MYFKGTAFRRAKAELLTYKKELITKSPVLIEIAPTKKTGAFNFWSGSGILIMAIAISAFCAITALWFELTEVDKKEGTISTQQVKITSPNMDKSK